MRYLRAFSKYAIGTGLVLVVGLLTTPILTRLISTEDMGKYSMFMTLGNLISTLLCLGLDQSYLRFYNDEKPESRNYLLRICLLLPMGVFLICGLFLLLFYKPFSVYITGEVSFSLVLLFNAYMLGLMVDRFWTLKIQMAQKEIAYSVLNFIRKIAYLLLALLFIKLSFYEESWDLMLAITLAEVFVLFFARIIELGNWKCVSKKIKTSHGRLLHYGIPFAFASTITLIFHSTDKMMLKALSDYHNIGIYSGAQSIVNLLSQAQAVFVAFWIPVVYEHYSKDNEDTKFYILMNKIVSYVMLMILIGLICFKDLVVLFLGADYREATYVFPFLAFMPVMTTISETTVMGINFKKKTGYHVYISVISMVVNAIGNYFLIKAFGAIGAAISTGLSYSVFFALRTYFSNKVFPVKYALKRYVVSAILVYGLAIYASFGSANLQFFLCAAGIVAFITVLYRDIIIECYKRIKEYLRYKFI